MAILHPGAEKIPSFLAAIAAQAWRELTGRNVVQALDALGWWLLPETVAVLDSVGIAPANGDPDNMGDLLFKRLKMSKTNELLSPIIDQYEALPSHQRSAYRAALLRNLELLARQAAWEAAAMPKPPKVKDDRKRSVKA